MGHQTTPPVGLAPPVLRPKPPNGSVETTPSPIGPDLDSLALPGAMAKGAAKVRQFEVRANFETGQSQVAGSARAQIDKTLDGVAASLKTLPADKQKALLADPNFKIEIEGRASNLGSDKQYDNLALSKRRAQETSKYVLDGLKARGIAVPATSITASGIGAPGRQKAPDNNDLDDRSASLRISLPGLGASVPAPVTGPPIPVPAPSDSAQARFDQLLGPVETQLEEGEAQSTTLGNREAIVNQTQSVISDAKKLIPSLSAEAQPGAQSFASALEERTGRLAVRASRERSGAIALGNQIKTDREGLDRIAQGKDMEALKTLTTQLAESYRNPDREAEALPADVREPLAKERLAFKRHLYDTVVRHSDDSKFNVPDNSYAIGRPGKKFKEALNKLTEFLQASGPASDDQRRKATEQLKSMGKAVEKFDDPLSKEAAGYLYEEISKAVAARLAPGEVPLPPAEVASKPDRAPTNPPSPMPDRAPPHRPISKPYRSPAHRPEPLPDRSGPLATEPMPNRSGPLATEPKLDAEASRPYRLPANQTQTKFNTLLKPIESRLATGEAADTTLAQREKIVREVVDTITKAKNMIPHLAPDAQPGARSYTTMLGERARLLAQRAGAERDKSQHIAAQIWTHLNQLDGMAQSQDHEPLKSLAIQLAALYAKSDAAVEALPSDVREPLNIQRSQVRRHIYDVAVWHSDQSGFNLPDNSYMFGRPGKAFKESQEHLKAFLRGNSPVTADERRKATEHLLALGNAVKKFEDPFTKEAASFVYEELSVAVSARLAS